MYVINYSTNSKHTGKLKLRSITYNTKHHSIKKKAAKYPIMNKIRGPDPAVMDAIDRGNVVVFFDIEMGEPPPGKSTPLGRIKLELFAKDVSDFSSY